MKRTWALIVAVLLALVLLAMAPAGCSLLLDLKECETDEDCITEGKVCHDGVCIPE